MNKIRKSEIRQIVNECVNNLFLNESYTQEHDFARQVCEWTKEKAKLLNVDEKELASEIIKMLKNYFEI